MTAENEATCGGTDSTSYLVDIDKTDIKRWGIIKFKHIQILYNHIQQLTEQAQEGNDNGRCE